MNFGTGQNKLDVLKKGWIYAAALLVVAITLSCTMVTGIFSKQLQILGSDGLMGLIAYVGTDGNIYTIARDGKQQTAITQDANPSPDSGEAGRIYQYPTWSPNGRKLAFMGFTGSLQTELQARLYTASSNGKERVEAFSSQDYFPFYLFWSPNSQYVTFLSNASGGNGLTLHMAAAAGGNSQILGNGQPFYWDWSPDNKVIIVHTGGAASDNPDARMALFELDGSIQKKELDLKPASFRAPAWSPGGKEMVLATESQAGGGELVLAGRDGNVKRVLTQLSGPVAFAWSPDGGSLAYTNPVEGDLSGLLKRLILIDPAQPDVGKDIIQGAVVAFFWSPDNQKIAYFKVSLDNPIEVSLRNTQSSSKINLEVQVYDLRSGETKQVAAFHPTNAFLQVFPFFDQYQRSGTIWSPDSKNLVLAAIDNNGGSSILVVGAEGGQSQKIAEGDLAFWSWK
jgi:Tol biopolymer transport system component